MFSSRQAINAFVYGCIGTGLLSASIGLAASDPSGGSMAGMKMDGMKMDGTKAAGAASPLKATVQIHPNPPISGENRLDVLISDARTGKPVPGLKVTASVAMTSMDMGTAHPAVRESGQGHYRVTAPFLMNGPWRLILSAQGPGGRLLLPLNFEVGGKKPWNQSGGSMVSAGAPKSGSEEKAGMAGMKMDAPGMAGMKMDAPGMAGMKMDAPGMAGMGAMDMGGGTPPRATAAVPRLKEKGVVTVSGNEDWDVRTGFGRNAPMVGMMIKMMVEGSGMQGMKMAPMKMDFGPRNFEEDGADSMQGMEMPASDISAGTNSGGGDSRKLAPEKSDNTARPSATESPNTAGPISPGENAVQPSTAAATVSPRENSFHPSDGVKAATGAPTRGGRPSPKSDRIEGMKMPGMARVGSARRAPAGGPAPLALTVKISPHAPVVGSNRLELLVRDKAGKPVPGLKIRTSVAMRSMDMGTTHPAAKEMGKGRYVVPVQFAMKGPWRVTIDVSASGRKSQSNSFDFKVKE